LLDLGFRSYVDEQSGDRLWPDLRLGSEGKYSERFCQWWPVFRRLVGLDREGLVFHSFRHTFAGVLERAGVPEPTVALLMGHRHRSITFGRYGGGKLITPRDKLDVIKNVDFGVDLTHLVRAAL
jgi:integrase